METKEIAQKENKNEIIQTEPVDSIAKCPRCGSNKVNWVFTKRGVSIKCTNCGFDTHFLQDVISHRQKELEVLPILKNMFSQLTFIENTPIDTHFLTGEKGDSPVRYDFKVFFFGKKLARCKVSVIQNTPVERYLITDEQYVQGRPKVFEYLAKIDGLLIFYFPDEPDETKKLAIASCREIKRNATRVTDRFGNDQFHIPVEVRKLIIKTDYQDFKNLLFKNFYDLITEGVYIV